MNGRETKTGLMNLIIIVKGEMKMSFYAIIDTKYSGETFLDPEIGIFNEDGIKEAKRLLYVKCYKRISCEYESKQSILKSHQEEQKVLSDMLKYFNSVDKIMQSKNAVIKRLDELEKKVTNEQLKTQRLISVLNSDNMDDVIKEAGYDIVEIPVLGHCDDEILKEFL